MVFHLILTNLLLLIYLSHSQKLVDSNIEIRCYLRQKSDVRHCTARFPFADSLKGHSEKISELFLRNSFFLTESFQFLMKVIHNTFSFKMICSC